LPFDAPFFGQFIGERLLPVDEVVDFFELQADGPDQGTQTAATGATLALA